MSAIFADTAEGLVRSSGIVGASSSFTFFGWFYVSGQPTLGTTRTFLYRGDDPVSLYAEYVFIGHQSSNNRLELNTTSQPSTYGPELGVGWHSIAYVYDTATNTHSVYADGATTASASLVSSIDAFAFTHEFVGTDTYDIDWDPTKAAYIREWNAALTGAQLNAEFLSATVVLAAGLWLDTPLLADLLDIGGSSRHWSQHSGTITFEAQPPTPVLWYIGGGQDGASAPYSPATFKGGWDSTPLAADDRIFSPYKIGFIIPLSSSESSATTPFRVCVCRAISPGLAPQSTAGTINMVLGLVETNVAADFYTKIYIYVTQGDSDLVRGVFVDWEETSAGGATEWPNPAVGRALLAAQAAGLFNILEGDRLVLEFGFRSENASITNRTGTMRIGGRGTFFEPLSLLAVGSTAVTTDTGYIVLTNPIALSATIPTNLEPETAIEITPLPYNSGSFNPISSTFLLWWKHTVTGTENGFIGTFAGVSGPVGNYTPRAAVLYPDGAGGFIQTTSSPFSTTFSAYTIPLTGETAVAAYLAIRSTTLTNPPGRNLIVSAVAASTLPTNLSGQYLITSERVDSLPATASIVDQNTGTITGLVISIPTENGIVADNGIYVLTESKFGSATDGQPHIYNADTSLRAIVTGATVTQQAGGQNQVPVATNGTEFYTAQYQTGIGAILVAKFDQDGTIIDTWQIPLPVGWAKLWSIAVARDDSVLYYSEYALNRAIKRWDLVSDAALADLIPANPGELYRDTLILRDGTLIFFVKTSLGFSAGTQYVRRYDSSGTLLDTYTFINPFTSPTGTWSIDHIAPTPDDPLAFVIWFQQPNATSGYVDNIFKRITIADGAASAIIPEGTVIDSEDDELQPEPDVDVPRIYFGISNSCPLVVFGAHVEATAPPAILDAVEPTPDSICIEVSQRLGDLSNRIWSDAEIDTYLLQGVREMCTQNRVIWDWVYPENLPRGFSFTALWELDYVNLGFSPIIWKYGQGDGMGEGQGNYTMDFDRRDTASLPVDTDTGRDEDTREGFARHTFPDEIPFLAEIGSDQQWPVSDLPHRLTEMERGLWDKRTIDASSHRVHRYGDSRYEAEYGEVYQYTWRKDGPRAFRKIRVPAALANIYEIQGLWGIARDLTDLDFVGDTDIEGPDANPDSLWGIPRQVPGEHPIGPFKTYRIWGTVRRFYRDGKNVRVEHWRIPFFDCFDSELPPRYRHYLTYYAMWRCLSRQGPGQDSKLANWYRGRWATALKRMNIRIERQNQERTGRLGGTDKIPTQGAPPRPKLPWPYGGRVR